MAHLPHYPTSLSSSLAHCVRALTQLLFPPQWAAVAHASFAMTIKINLFSPPGGHWGRPRSFDVCGWCELLREFPLWGGSALTVLAK